MDELLRAKRFLANDVQDNSLGSPPSEFLLKKLKPKYWFSAHLHTRFEATVYHTSPKLNPDEIILDDSEHDEPPSITKFLALDKCLPGRSFIEHVDIPVTSNGSGFSHVKEWIAIVRATHSMLSFKESQSSLLPDDDVQK
jgi:lariat debranching enzyme